MALKASPRADTPQKPGPHPFTDPGLIMSPVVAGASPLTADEDLQRRVNAAANCYL